MSLRKKALIVISVTVLGLIAVVYTVLRIVLLGNLLSLEEQTARRNVRRALDAVEAQLGTMDEHARRWASREDTRDFIRDRNPTYVKSNLADEMFIEAGLSLVAYADKSHRIVFAKAMDLRKRREMPFPQQLRQEIEDGSLFSAQGGVKGIELLPSGPVLIASRPIPEGEGKGGVAGAVIVGRPLDLAEIQRLARMTYLSLAVSPLDESEAPPGLYAAAAGEAPIAVEPSDTETMTGYGLVKDACGRRDLVLKVGMSREMYIHGVSSLRRMLLLLLAVGGACGAVVLLLLERIVFSRLSRLGEDVSRIRTSRDLSARVSSSGKDELASLAGAINKMLEGLREWKATLRKGTEKHRGVFEDSLEAMSVTKDGKIVDVNSAWLKLHGYERKDEVIGMDLMDIIHPDDRKILAKRRRMSATQRRRVCQMRDLRKDGSVVDVEVYSSTTDLGGEEAILTTVRDITERKRASQALRQSEEKYRSLVESSPDLIFIADREGRITYINHASTEFCGKEPGEITGTKLMDLLPGSEGEMMLEGISRVFEENRVVQLDHVVSVGGGLRHYSTALTPIHDSQGNVVSVMGIARNITALKNVAEKLAESEEKYRTLFEDSLEAMSVSQEGKIVDVNPAWLRLHGLKSKEEVIGKDVLDIIHPEDRAILRQRRRMPAAERERVCQMRDLRKDGSVVDVEIYSSAITLAGKQAILTTVRDITDQKRAINALLESERKFRQLYEFAPTPYHTLTPDGTITNVNRKWCEVLGYRKEEVIGKSIFDFVLDKDRHLAKASFESKKRSKKFFTRGSEREYLGKDGQVRTFLINDFFSLDEDGNIRSVHTTMEDITERKRLQEQILRSQKMQSIGTLASGVAHNFNNILSIILGNAELAKMSLEPSHEANEFLDEISKATERAAGLAQQLLSVARQQAAERTRISVSALVAGISQSMRVMLDSNIQVTWDAPEDLPDIEVNQSVIEQILTNMCLNARDAMPKGGKLSLKAETVELSSEFCEAHENMKPGLHVCITVTDTGIGMDDAALSNVFDPFFTTKGPDKGIGLGLATAYGTIVSYGGCIDVESEVGKGSSFHIYLPAAPEAESKPASSDTQSVKTGTETILIVDDEKDLADVARRNLKLLGYTVLTAGTGRDAIETYRREHDRIDLVLLDYMMPDMDGEDTYAELKKINPDVKVILSSGYDEKGKVKPLLDAGVDGFVHKPFHLAELSQTIRNVLDRS